MFARWLSGAGVASLCCLVAAAPAGEAEQMARLKAEIDRLQQSLAAQQAQTQKLQQRLAESLDRLEALRQETTRKDATIAAMKARLRRAAPPSTRPAVGAAGHKLTAKERTYLDEARTQRKDAIRSAEQHVRQFGALMARIMQGKVSKRSPGIVIDARTGTYTFRTAELKGERARQVQERINDLHKHLAALKKNDPPFVPALRGGFAVGKVGGFAYPVTVRRIIDNANMIVRASVDLGPGPGNIWAVQKLDIWLSGVATDKLADDTQVDLPGPFEITGTRQYRSAVGEVRTLFVAEPFDAARVNRLLREEK